jgi:hypothetical protein
MTMASEVAATSTEHRGAHRCVAEWLATLGLAVMVVSGCGSTFGARCDRDALGRAAADITGGDAGQAPTSDGLSEALLQVVEAVWRGCPGLPDQARERLDGLIEHPDPWADAGVGVPVDRVDPLESRLPGHVRLHGDPLSEPSADTWSSQACADYEAMRASMKALSMVAGRSRAVAGATFFDLCGLGRADLVTREEFLIALRPTGLLGFALHGSLVGDGVDREVSRALSRAIVFANGHATSWSNEVNLPSAKRGDPLRDDAMVHVVEWSGQRIRYQGSAAVILSPDGSIDPADLTDGAIGPLAQDMKVERERRRAEEKGGADEAVVFVVDRDVPWAGAALALETASRAGWTTVSVAVLVADEVAPFRSLTFHLAPREAVASVHVHDGTTTLRCGGSDVQVALPGDLPACVTPGSAIVLAASPSTPWQDVVDVIDTLDGHPVVPARLVD